MIKHVMINRFSDGIVFCETSDDYSNRELQEIKMKVKNYHREATPYTKPELSSLRQIQNSQYNIFYKVSSFVIFTVIVELGYPLKLVNVFIDNIATAFFDEAKTILGANDLPSRLQSIQGSHYFVKFDRVIKQKRKEFDDPKSIKNTDRMKKELEQIQSIMKENMNEINARTSDLEGIGQKARDCVEEARKFQRGSKKLKWNMWFKKNLLWIVIVITVVVLGWLII